MLTRKKYRLLAKEMVIPNSSGWNSTRKLEVYRIQALRSIPERGIKKGDLGGYVSSPDTLSQDGTCWIGYNASALGKVHVLDDAYIGDRALVLCDFSKSMLIVQESARIFDNAKVTIAKPKTDDDDPAMISRISGNSAIFGNARVASLNECSGNVRIFDEAHVHLAEKLSGNIEIKGRAVLHRAVHVTGQSTISEDAIINESAKVIDSKVSGKAQIGAKQTVSGGDFREEGIFMSPEKEIPKIVIGSPVNLVKNSDEPISLEVKSKVTKVLELFASVKKDIASYETDIVKIIKYPVMTDRTDLNTLKMTKLLKKAERLVDSPADPEFEETVSDLEDAFLAAESNALKLAATLLSEADRKKTEKAKDLLAIAADEGSSENEKKVSFKQAFKNLEGVIAVPEVAIDTFRLKIGLQEIEM